MSRTLKLTVRNGKMEEPFHCGGALISRQWVLTAAHCFYPKGIERTKPNGYFIKAGVHKLTRKSGSEQRMQIKKILIHENYNRRYLNDIALLQLVQPLELRPFVRTVCLPEKEEGDLAIRDDHGIATGWGVTRALKVGEEPTKEDLSNVLKHASFKIQSDELCQSSTKYLVNSTVTFCAGDGLGKSDACQGDSGGAFVLEAQRGKVKRWAWVAAGLVSWGEGCAQEKRYGYYTRVYPFIDWIRKKMKENSAKEDKE